MNKNIKKNSFTPPTHKTPIITSTHPYYDKISDFIVKFVPIVHGRILEF